MRKVLYDLIFVVIPLLVCADVLRLYLRSRTRNLFYCFLSAAVVVAIMATNMLLNAYVRNWSFNVLLITRTIGAAVLGSAITAFIIFYFVCPRKEE